MDSRYEGLKSGWYRSGGYGKLLEVRKLDKCIRYLKRWDLLSKAIVYSMVTPWGERLGEEWGITFKALNHSIKQKDWENIAVYSLLEEPHTFNDIRVVDYGVLRSKGKEQFLSLYPQLKQLLLLELRLITYG